MLFERDYTILTEEEKKRYNLAEEYLRAHKGKSKILTPAVLNKYFELKPMACHYYESLFPNNYLDPQLLKNKEQLSQIEKGFISLLNSNPTERSILNYINDNGYYNLIASVFHYGYTFGHHDAYMFKEFELTSTYKADYLLVGKNSHGYHFIFIELENPTGLITNADGEFGQTIRKGLKQVKDWDKWLERNFQSLSLIFDKSKNPEINLPNEFRYLNKTRINYVVIAGRRSQFNDNTYEEKRRLLRQNCITLMHYDNLIDSFKDLQKSDNY